MEKDKRIIDLTVGQLEELIVDMLQRNLTYHQSEPPKKVYGIKGLAGLLGCSTQTAQRIKLSGVIDKAVSQYGRTIIIDADKALTLLKS